MNVVTIIYKKLKAIATTKRIDTITANVFMAFILVCFINPL